MKAIYLRRTLGQVAYMPTAGQQPAEAARSVVAQLARELGVSPRKARKLWVASVAARAVNK